MTEIILISCAFILGGILGMILNKFVLNATADDISIVKCHECKRLHPDSHFCYLIKGTMQNDDFCSYGKKRED